MTQPDRTEKSYVLGTHDAEIERLGLQHGLWRHRTLECWRRARLARGAHVLDVGAGPGFATLDLAELVGPEGRVTAIDLSTRFLGVLKARAQDRGYGNIRTFEVDLNKDALPEGPYDFVWARWCHIFLKHPRELIARIAKAVKPGGRVVLHEYADYGAWRMIPDRPSFNHFVGAVMKSWRETGGEPDIGAQIPGWLESEGLTVLSSELVSYFLAPSDPMWVWPTSYVDNGGARLVELNQLTREEARRVSEDVVAAAGDPVSRMITPTLIEIIAVR
jgi:SAM-dependent methyltransferase